MDKKGFTLIEMMIVVAIIAVLVSIALPNMLGARKTANEKAALAEVRTLGTSLETYYVRENKYASNLTEVVDNNLLPARYSGVTQSDTVDLGSKGYNLTFDTLTEDNYQVTATPKNKRFGSKCFRVSSGGTLEQANFDGSNCNGWQTI